MRRQVNMIIYQMRRQFTQEICYLWKQCNYSHKQDSFIRVKVEQSFYELSSRFKLNVHNKPVRC